MWHSAAMSDIGCRSPVFVLSASRSGSTLLRFVLDSHPDLACPPETGVTAACAGLMHSWDILENSRGERASAEAAGQAASPLAVAAVRATVDDIYGRYLLRRGKRRWCDKSLGSHQDAELAALLYPEAKFICLYRHCMDVIASGVEACPWGLYRFGFDRFAAQNPGNSVAAIGSYWLAAARSILAFEERHPDACHRVRYEDLVTAPEETAAGIFSFLGEAPVPDIREMCFQVPHEGNGPGDEEIWFTGGITADSMGGGVRVPAAALVPEVRQGVNDVLARLGYRTVGDEWNALARRVDVRADATDHRRPERGASGHDRAGDGEPGRPEESGRVARSITDRLTSLPGHELRAASAVWPAVAGRTVAIVVEDADGDHAEVQWSFPASPGTAACPAHGNEDPVRPVCTIIAGPGTWRALLSGRANLVTEMTAGRLRCVNRRDGHRIRSDEVHAIAWLLGLTRVPLIRDPAARVPELTARDA
jgi:hypothetical protein